MECLTSLVGVKELCTDLSVQPYFYLDDAEGIDRIALAELTKPSVPSGLQFGKEIIESASRFLMTDIESLVPKGYSIKSSLNTFCNTCTYTGMVSNNVPETGIVVKNISTTKNGYLSIDSLRVMINNTGNYTIVLNDGIAPKLISYDFTAGTELVITNINFKTSSKSVKIYFYEPDVLINALNCPTQKSCGCSGNNAQSRDITIKGLYAGNEFSTQYGFVPCASVICSIDNVICSIVNQQPKLFAVALFYRSAAKYFSEFQVSNRANRSTAFDQDEKKDLAEMYMTLYYERLRGSNNVKGIADNMAAAMNNLNDSCVECKRLTATAWAIG